MSQAVSYSCSIIRQRNKAYIASSFGEWATSPLSASSASLSSVRCLASDYYWRSCLSNPSMLFYLETAMPRIWASELDGCDNCSYSSQDCSQPPQQPSAVPSRSSAWQSRIWLVSHSAQPGTALFCLPQCLSEPIWHWFATC